MKRVLVLGAYGMLGHKLFLGLGEDFETYATCRKKRTGAAWSSKFSSGRLMDRVEAGNISSVISAIKRSKPDAVVNCIGIVKQHEAAQDPVQVMSINSLFPQKLALECAREGVRLIHFGTDGVYSGKKGMYKLDDLPDAEDIYGKTKYLGEVLRDGCMTIRSSVIGRELGTRNGLVEWFLGQRGGRVKGYKNAIYSGFTTIEMTNIVRFILKEHADLHGLWQIASAPISKHDLLALINKEMKLGIEIEPDYKFRCDRSLDGSMFTKRTGYHPPSWGHMIEEMAEDSQFYDKWSKG